MTLNVTVKYERGIPDDPRVDVALDNDKAVHEDGAQQHEHAHTIGQHNVARHHCCASEDADAHLMRHKNDGPVHEEPALQRVTFTGLHPGGTSHCRQGCWDEMSAVQVCATPLCVCCLYIKASWLT